MHLSLTSIQTATFMNSTELSMRNVPISLCYSQPGMLQATLSMMAMTSRAFFMPSVHGVFLIWPMLVRSFWTACRQQSTALLQLELTRRQQQTLVQIKTMIFINLYHQLYELLTYRPESNDKSDSDTPNIEMECSDETDKSHRWFPYALKIVSVSAWNNNSDDLILLSDVPT